MAIPIGRILQVEGAGAGAAPSLAEAASACWPSGRRRGRAGRQGGCHAAPRGQAGGLLLEEGGWSGGGGRAARTGARGRCAWGESGRPAQSPLGRVGGVGGLGAVACEHPGPPKRVGGPGLPAPGCGLRGLGTALASHSTPGKFRGPFPWLPSFFLPRPAVGVHVQGSWRDVSAHLCLASVPSIP
jgi:hypothetical protein